MYKLARYVMATCLLLDCVVTYNDNLEQIVGLWFFTNWLGESLCNFTQYLDAFGFGRNVKRIVHIIQQKLRFSN